MLITNEFRKDILREIINIAVESNNYIYVLDKDFDKLKNEYSDLLLDYIGNMDLLEEGLKNNFSNDFFEKNDDLYSQIINSVEKILYENLYYTPVVDDYKEGTFWIKEFNKEDEYYLYLIELALESGVDFDISTIKEDKIKYIKIEFDFIDKYKLTPEIFIVDESFKNNTPHISDDVSRKILEVYTGSINGTPDGLLIYFNEEFMSDNAEKIVTLLIELLNKCHYKVHI